MASRVRAARARAAVERALGSTRARRPRRRARRGDAARRASTLFGDETRGSVDADETWVAGMVQFWLDEEWERGATINRDIGVAAGASYARCKAQMAREGEDEVLQRLVMALAADLMDFDFTDSFVSAFEVANKVIEMLMLRAGADVCCVSEDDITRAERYEATASSADAPTRDGLEE